MSKHVDSKETTVAEVTAKSGKGFSLRSFILVFLMMIAAAVLGILVFSRTSLRLDEAQSLFQVSRDVPGLLRLVGQDVHVPGYHLILHFWLILFGGLGDRIVIARYLSLIFMIALIPSIYLLARQVFSRNIALFAALLVTISPFMQWYGSEARMYSMLALITVVHQIFFVKVFKTGYARQWVWFALTAMIGVYTHYFFWFVLLTEALFYFAFIKRFPRGSFVKFILSAVLAIAAISPWLLYVKSLGLASNTQPYLPTPSSGDLFNTYAQFIFGFQTDYLNTIIVALWPALVLLAFFALRRSRRPTPEVIFFVFAAVLPVIAAFVISITVKPFFLSRYLVVSLPAFVILIAWFLSIYRKAIRYVIGGALVVLTLGLLIVEIASPNTPVKEDYRKAVGYLNQNVSSRDVVIASAPFTIYPIEYYYTGSAALTTEPVWNRFEQGSVPAFSEQGLAADAARSTNSYSRAWVILSYDQGYNDKVRKYYDGHYERLSMRTFSQGLVVYEYKLRYDPPVRIQ